MDKVLRMEREYISLIGTVGADTATCAYDFHLALDEAAEILAIQYSFEGSVAQAAQAGAKAFLSLDPDVNTEPAALLSDEVIWVRAAKVAWIMNTAEVALQFSQDCGVDHYPQGLLTVRNPLLIAHVGGVGIQVKISLAIFYNVYKPSAPELAVLLARR